MTGRLCLIESARLPPAASDGLVARVGACLGVPVRRLMRGLDFARAWDPARGQHDASSLVAQVADHAAGSPDKFLAVVDVDLFVPVLTFVFGQAQLGGSSGVVSVHRLHDEFYGVRPDPARFSDRLVKEVVHEAGHLYGLLHCRDWSCVMRSSTYVEEIDLKGEAFCPSCAEALRVAAAAAAGG